MFDSREFKFENGVINTPPMKFVLDPKGMGHAFFTKMKEFQDRIFQIDALTGVEETYESVLQRCIRTAITMQTYGISDGDIIMICALNTLDSCIPFFSALFIGAIVVCIDPFLPESDASHIIKQIDSKLIFVSSEGLDTVEKNINKYEKNATIVAIGKSEKYLNFCDFLQRRDDESTFLPVDIKDIGKTAFIYYSSGTTGLPKGVCLSHRSFLGQIGVALEVDNCYDRILACARLCYSTCSFNFGISIMCGGTRIVLSKFDAAQVWNAINDYSPTYLFVPTFPFILLCKENTTFNKNVSSVKTVISSGNTLTQHQMLSFRQLFPDAKVIPGYGLTEIGFVCYFKSTTPQELLFLKSKVNSLGTVINGISYKVVDIETGKTLGVGEKGELCLKSDNLLSHYYNIECAEVWDCEGWYKTGDIVYYDEDLYFYYVERLKEMIRYKNHTLAPKFIENIILNHPSVLNACIIGVPQKEEGEYPMAIVLLKPSADPKDFENLLCKYVEDNISEEYWIRGGVRVVDKFPMTVTGKIDKRQLRNMFLTQNV